MTALRASVYAEMVKATRSVTLRLTTIIAVAGICGISVGLLAAIRSGRTDLTVKLGSLGTVANWAAIVGGATQIAAAGGLLALGVGLSWLFGREFADRTIEGLFGLPVSRAQIATGKLVVFCGWAVVLAVAVPAVLLVCGLASSLGMPDGDAWGGLLRLAAVIILSALLVTPCAWVTTLGRNLLAGVAVAVGLIVIAQVGAMVAAVTSFPLTAPALWAMRVGPTPVVGLALTPVVGATFAALTVAAWHRMQRDR
jgi:ABC-2 type transport system permease protein